MATVMDQKLSDFRAIARGLRTQKPWSSWDGLPAGSPPTMLMKDEQQLLNWLGANWYEGEGAIIDAGCFLGGSTFALATGLEHNSDAVGSHIHSYDLFRVCGSSWEGNTLRTNYGLEKDESFLPNFRKHMSRYSDRLVVHEGDFLKEQWDLGAIEILFIDIAKTANLHDHLMEQFFPQLIPGRSIVIQQDYGWSYYHWGNIAMESLSNRFVFLGDVPGASRVYLCVEAVSPEDVRRACYATMYPEDKFARMEMALATVVGTDYEPHLLMNLALVARETGRPDVALATANDLFARFPNSPAAAMAADHWPCPYRAVATSETPVVEMTKPLEPAPTEVVLSSSNKESKRRSVSHFVRHRIINRVFPSSNAKADRLLVARIDCDGEITTLDNSSTQSLIEPQVDSSATSLADEASTELPAKSVPNADSVDRRCWKNSVEFDPIWKQRIQGMAKWIRPGVVADFGCGMMWLEQVMPPGCTYVPIDMIQRDSRTHVIDLNARELVLPQCDIAFFSGCFEYVDDLSRLIDAVEHAGAKQIIASYCTRERFPSLELRRTLTWRSDFRLHDLLVKLLRFGQLEKLDEVNGNTILSVVRRAS